MVMRSLILALSLLTSSVFAASDNLLLERINTQFSHAWMALSKSIKAHNYKSAYLQRCDFALNERHYKSDKYRILFYGDYQEMKDLSRKYPELVPYFPLKLTVMEEGKHTLIVGTAPITLMPLVETDEERMIILRWHEDMKSILKQVKAQYN